MTVEFYMAGYDALICVRRGPDETVPPIGARIFREQQTWRVTDTLYVLEPGELPLVRVWLESLEKL